MQRSDGRRERCRHSPTPRGKLFVRSRRCRSCCLRRRERSWPFPSHDAGMMPGERKDRRHEWCCPASVRSSPGALRSRYSRSRTCFELQIESCHFGLSPHKARLYHACSTKRNNQASDVVFAALQTRRFDQGIAGYFRIGGSQQDLVDRFFADMAGQVRRWRSAGCRRGRPQSRPGRGRHHPIPAPAEGCSALLSGSLVPWSAGRGGHAPQQGNDRW